MKNFFGSIIIIFYIIFFRKSDADKVLQLFISENRDYLNKLLKVSTKDDRSEFSLLKVIKVSTKDNRSEFSLLKVM